MCAWVCACVCACVCVCVCARAREPQQAQTHLRYEKPRSKEIENDAKNDTLSFCSCRAAVLHFAQRGVAKFDTFFPLPSFLFYLGLPLAAFAL